MFRKGDISMQVDRLESAIERTAKVTGKSVKEVTVDAAIFFSQSAARGTPPNAGRAKFTRKVKNRPIIRRVGRGRGKTRYMVPYRTAKKRGVKWFDNRGDAKAFASIKWRGIGRAGWYAALPALGVSTANQPGSPAVKSTAARWGSGKVQKERLMTAVVITNRSPSIKQSYATIIARTSLGKASRRMLGALRHQTAEKMKRAWK